MDGIRNRILVGSRAIPPYKAIPPYNLHSLHILFTQPQHVGHHRHPGADGDLLRAFGQALVALDALGGFLIVGDPVFVLIAAVGQRVVQQRLVVGVKVARDVHPVAGRAGSTRSACTGSG